MNFRELQLPVLAGLLGAMLLSACVQQPAHTSGPVIVERGTGEPPVSGASFPDASPASPPVSVQPPRKLADGSQLPAVKGLLAASDRALAQGEVDLAAVNLERAQRLAPQSAVVYQRLARVRLMQKRPGEAEQLARKALAFASAPAQRAELWRLIARARQQQGKSAEAREAVSRAAALEQGLP